MTTATLQETTDTLLAPTEIWRVPPLYVKDDVNAVFSGHSHCYERVKPA